MRELSQRSANLQLHLGPQKNEGIAERSARRRINSSAGRFRKKSVPTYCWRLEARQTKVYNHAPKQ